MRGGRGTGVAEQRRRWWGVCVAGVWQRGWQGSSRTAATATRACTGRADEGAGRCAAEAPWAHPRAQQTPRLAPAWKHPNLCSRASAVKHRIFYRLLTQLPHAQPRVLSAPGPALLQTQPASPPGTPVHSAVDRQRDNSNFRGPASFSYSCRISCFTHPDAEGDLSASLRQRLRNCPAEALQVHPIGSIVPDLLTGASHMLLEHWGAGRPETPTACKQKFSFTRPL